MTLDAAVKDRFLDLRAAGKSLRAIAEELNVHPNTLFRWNKQLKDQVAERRALELEVLAEKYYMLREKRITLIGRQLERIIQDLDRYNLEDVSTPKLLDLLLKYTAALRREEQDLAPAAAAADPPLPAPEASGPACAGINSGGNPEGTCGSLEISDRQAAPGFSGQAGG
jgi:transposase-like protein